MGQFKGHVTTFDAHSILWQFPFEGKNSGVLWGNIVSMTMRLRLRPNHRPYALVHLVLGFMRKYKRTTSLLTILALIFFIVYGRTIFHVTKEFIVHSNFNFKLCKRFHQMTHLEQSHSKVPKIIHQIFLNASDDSVEFFRKYTSHRESWQQKNPDFKYILWNEEKIQKLINKSYPSIMPLYRSYKDKWIARSDIARYIVVHFMGGVYADIDLQCTNSLTSLYAELGDKSVALNYSYTPFGIANDFFLASKNHEFMAHVIDGLPEADVLYFTPYLNTMFRTGPMYMLGRYLNYIHQEDIYFLQDSRLYTSGKIGDNSWHGHGLDGYFITVVYTGVDSLQLISVILLIIFIVRLNKLFRVRKSLVRKSKSNVRIFDRRSVSLPILEEEAL